jgi:hypothetical protein
VIAVIANDGPAIVIAMIAHDRPAVITTVTTIVVAVSIRECSAAQQRDYEQ